MDMETLNFAAVPVTLLLSLLVAPFFLRKAGYLAGKVAFGTLSITVALMGISGVISVIQRKAGLEAVPLAWLAPVAAVVLAVRELGKHARR